MDDADKRCSLNSNIIVIVGHSEFWTRKARLNFDYHVDIGKNALIQSEITIWKQLARLK